MSFWVILCHFRNKLLAAPLFHEEKSEFANYTLPESRALDELPVISIVMPRKLFVPAINIHCFRIMKL